MDEEGKVSANRRRRKITIYDNLMDVLLLAAYLVLLFGSFVAVVMFWSR